MRFDCGGCDGLGAHWRWCREVVGFTASVTGQRADHAEDLADSVGGNNPGAANHLYAAAQLLREDALKAKANFQERATT